ncbi:Uncharacterised protein [Yersinia aldovae]|uniref:helix-turn-helix domain-containing protein n=1 Tax=Yersinia aldovae TaxID=29483 RepID=UPI0005E6FC09|nr:helix-turn-helix transcriptional regulator [Yersinia aldovae]CNJ03787.1 Uncharacterised protein [Yersinia aldovae]
MCISERLKYVLTLKNIKSIKAFSEIAGLPYRTAQSYLNGDREPNVAGLMKLCTQLCVNLNWLLTGVGDIFINESESLTKPAMTKEKQALLNAFDEMSPEQRRAILEVGRVISQPKSDKLAG